MVKQVKDGLLLFGMKNRQVGQGCFINKHGYVRTIKSVK
jgi:hypothetical protein